MSATPLRLLLVEDSEEDALLVLRELRHSGFAPDPVRVDSAEAFERALLSERWDLILADYSLPAFSGMAALALFQRSGFDIPFLLVSGMVGEEVAVAAMIAGAKDYVLKDNLTRLGPAVIRELRDHAVRQGRREDHQRMVASERRFTTIFRNSPVATVITDVAHGTILDLNPAALTLTGLKREELLGQPTTAFGSWFALPGLSQVVAAALAAGPGHAVERPVPSAVRGTVTVLTSFSLIELEGQSRLVVMMQDITDRKLAEETLRENEERYRLLVENSHDLVAEIDREGRLLYASPNYTAVTGYAAAELAGARIFQLIHPEDHPAASAHLEERSDHSRSRYRFRHRSGRWLSFETTGRAFTTSAGEDRVVLVTRDLTEQLRAEETRRALEMQLRQAQKMEAIGTLAGGIAHDFNNILTGIFGYVQLAEMDLPLDHPIRPYLEGIMRGSERARDLVAQILTFSRRREQQRSLAHLAPIVTDALRLLRASLPSTIAFRTHIDRDTPPVLCDGSQLHQVIMNLGTNAAYAMRDQGGTLTVKLQAEDPDPALAVSHPQFRSRRPVCLTVTDTGVGMDGATKDRLFEPFFTTKPIGEGSGLGLAVVHGIVQSHEGAILCESQPGEGSSFRVYFPTVDVEGMESPLAPAKLPQGGGERVMLVDDEDVVVAIAARMLERLGYRTASYTDARLALDHALQDPQAYDLVLTDLTMPGITGVELARRVKAARPTLPVVITTGFMNAREVDSARALGVVEFLEKPFVLSALAECLRRALHPPPPVNGSRPPLPLPPDRVN